MSDMSQTIIPKSDQLNSDDLLAGPRTITIREMNVDPGTEQPVKVFFQGDNGKPYLPCKSMRRVMVAIWGPDASIYTGRAMTLFRDPSVTWGGMEVGGIRISHMSHLEAKTVVVLTATKKARKPFTVLPLVAVSPGVTASPSDAPKEAPEVAARRLTDELLAKIAGCADENAVHDLRAAIRTQAVIDRLTAKFPGLATEVTTAFTTRFNDLALEGMPA